MAVYEPQNYGSQFVLMLGSMVCWGSWASTLKLTPGWAFQLFYWDYVLGLLASSLAWGFALGGGIAGFPSSLIAFDMRHVLYTVAAGIVFNLANQLLVATIDIAGLAVALPVGIRIAWILGVAVNNAIAPIGNSLLLFGGVAFVLIAIVFDAFAYRHMPDLREVQALLHLQPQLRVEPTENLSTRGSARYDIPQESDTCCISSGCALDSNRTGARTGTGTGHETDPRPNAEGYF